ncbi:hypothetical protein H072_7965 [Dactylellina haptotyla CBS 200.50]|uniref:Uncharacterized protein n=1 Tax=Dactylellina haptotyla (strain CBS 200.50) TaxID=1284197 RepID=S8A562_DACHA|nr:hypothetical protein H072_7965 [Dactylellina haptotyla CBS 200.50]
MKSSASSISSIGSCGSGISHPPGAGKRRPWSIPISSEDLMKRVDSWYNETETPDLREGINTRETRERLDLPVLSPFDVPSETTDWSESPMRSQRALGFPDSPNDGSVNEDAKRIFLQRHHIAEDYKEDNFWCGFCAKLITIPPYVAGLLGPEMRAHHVADHFMMEETDIRLWVKYNECNLYDMHQELDIALLLCWSGNKTNIA